MISIFSAIKSAFGRPRNLLQMRGHDFSAVGSVAEQFDMLASDKEIKLLLLWAVISPAVGIGYLIWLKYPKMRLLALFAIAIGLVQFYTQFAAFASFFKQFGIILKL